MLKQEVGFKNLFFTFIFDLCLYERRRPLYHLPENDEHIRTTNTLRTRIILSTRDEHVTLH